ncbi:MAG: hypothetical protein Q4F17_00055 [Eubacteriales bacterium]|nr:hypothetical protein [Eubacteriales bacterium]
MKKSVNIILACLLILLGIVSYRSSRPRALDQCFPQGPWESVAVRSFSPVAGETVSGYALDMSARELREAMAGVTVFRGQKAEGRTGPSISLEIAVGGQQMLAEIGEDGTVALCDSQARWTWWRALDGKLYQRLTEQW